MKKFILLLLAFAGCLSAQNASDYFPAETGYKWFYKITPFDSLNAPIDSMVSYQIDSFATVTDYQNKLSNVVVSKYGMPDNILQMPWLDTSYIHTETSNIWNYVDDLGGLAGGLGFDYAGWYSNLRLGSPTTSTYTLFTKDTVVTIDPLTYTITFEVTGRRVNDQIIMTPYGELNCKKFVIRPAIKAKLSILPAITLFAMPDTIYIAPGHYMMKSVRPTSVMDLSLFGYPAITIPGSMIEAITPPAVLSIDPLLYFAGGEGDTISIIIDNAGEDTLFWNASVLNGMGWINLASASGIDGDTLVLIVAPNDTTIQRFGFIEISAPGAFNAPQYISVTQSEKILNVKDSDNTSPDEYYLAQNYPNPFNPVTSISFTIKSGGNVKLLLYDMLGNVTSVITEGYYSPGTHRVNFNAEGLSSGVYIYRIITEGYSAVRKMVILK